MGGLYNVREQQFYAGLLKDSQDAVRDLKKKGWELAEIYWRWGRKLAEQVDTKYGDAAIVSIAEDVGKHHSILYRARAAGIKYPTLVSLKEVWELGKKGGREMSWSRLTREALPSPTDDPDAYGGKTQVVDQLMHDVETLGAKVEKLNEFLDAPEIDEDTKRQIVGVIQQVEEIVGEDSPAANIDGGYLQYIKTKICVECDDPEVEPWILTLSGLPPQTQFSAIPLCKQHFKQIKGMVQSETGKLWGIDFYKAVLKLVVPYMEALDEDNMQG